MIADLMSEIETALLADDGDALERAWYALYEIDPQQAVCAAKAMKPLARVS